MAHDHHEHSCACHAQHCSGAAHEHTHTHEAGCACCAGHEHPAREKSLVPRLVFGGALFICGYFFEDPLSWFLYFAAYLLLGYDVLFYAVKNLFKGFVLDENFLMSIATIGAIIIRSIPEAVAVMLFYQIGEFFSDRAVARSKKSISDLMDIRPEYANLVLDSGTKKVAPEEVPVGAVIAVLPGEKIPLDGEVIEGCSFLDTSALTGESVPRQAAPGSAVLSGSINTASLLKIRVTKAYKDSSVSKIMELLQNAQNRKSNSERFITMFAKRYTPIVVGLALLIAIIPPLFTGFDFSTWVYRALIFLVVSCPCALVVSVPLGFFAGIGNASKKGILIKGSETIEALTKIQAVAFDKTGTITKGVFEVTAIRCNGVKQEFLNLLAHAEHYSTHPIGTAVANAYQGQIDESRISDYQELAGKGISVRIDGKQVWAGNAKLMVDNGIVPPSVQDSGSIVFVAVEHQYYGYAAVSDSIKEDSREAVSALKQAGLYTVMLTGDIRETAERVGQAVGVHEIRAELLPQDKVACVEKIQASSKLAFAGDGINDAPVLAYADVGIAMGGVGSDSAIEAADMVIMSDSIAKIPEAIRLSKKTMRIVWQNIIFAIGVKVFVMLLSALGFSTMWMAIFADVGLTFLAVLNSMRAFYAK